MRRWERLGEGCDWSATAVASTLSHCQKRGQHEGQQQCRTPSKGLGKGRGCLLYTSPSPRDRG
eukprot:756381-Rhodomonas_salina.1